MKPPPTARSVALIAIRRVTEQAAYSNIAVLALLARSGLDRRDRAFATELAYGTLRRLLPVDAAITRFASRPIQRITPAALAALRLGAYQILFTDVAHHAAVDETVSLAMPRERGFVNAVLRRMAGAPWRPSDGDDDGAIAERTGLAHWAVGELKRLLGAEAEPAAAALAAPGKVCLRVNTCRSTTEHVLGALRDAGHEVERATVDPGCVIVAAGDPTTFPGFHEGWFAIQDQASAFTARALDAQPGERVWDACAGPGGKAAALACDVGSDGMLLASDLHPARVERIRVLARRLGVHVTVLAQDARRPAVAASFDAVLVDAPCSGIGAARRRPELLWRVRKQSLSRLARLQVALTSSAADLLRPGGRLVYAVCTFPRAETDAAVDAILRHRPELEPLQTPGPDGLAFRHRLWPHRHGSDAMFVAAFRRLP
jgi:16S rRNA (cytosine967-C5)-methyltransferase